MKMVAYANDIWYECACTCIKLHKLFISFYFSSKSFLFSLEFFYFYDDTLLI